MTRHLADDRGSMPLVLLASIIVAGVIVALAMTVTTGVDTARRDRDWNAAVHAADAGIQQAVALLREGNAEEICGAGVCEGVLRDGGTYEATYEETADGWTVRSTGEYNGVRRTVKADFVPPPVAGSAGLIGVHGITVNGSLPEFQSDPPTVLGTGGYFDMSAQTACDKLGFERYGPDVEDVCNQPASMVEREFPNIAAAAFSEGGACEDREVWPEYPAARPEGEPEPWVRGQTYCAKKIVVPTGTHHLLSGPEGSEVVIFVDPGYGDESSTASDAFDLRANASVNFPTVHDPGDATELLIFVRRGELSALNSTSGNPRLSGFVYAPESDCRFRGTVRVNGGVVCRTMELSGNIWFRQPDDLHEAAFGDALLGRYSEEINP
jgi:hypothetical protein